MNVYGSHMGFIWESYANRPAWSVGLFDPEADAAYAQAGGAGARPGGVFRKRRFPERILKRGDGPRHSGGRRPITRPAINVPKPDAIDGYRRSWMPTRWLKCCPIFEATRSASSSSFSLISKIGCRHVNVQLLRIRQRDRLFVVPFNAEKVQGGGECEYQWPCCALLRFKTHVGGQDASLMQRLRILCSIGHTGECVGSLM